jgi:hypothetical protein
VQRQLRRAERVQQLTAVLDEADSIIDDGELESNLLYMEKLLRQARPLVLLLEGMGRLASMQKDLEELQLQPDFELLMPANVPALLATTISALSSLSEHCSNLWGDDSVDPDGLCGRLARLEDQVAEHIQQRSARRSTLISDEQLKEIDRQLERLRLCSTFLGIKDPEHADIKVGPPHLAPLCQCRGRSLLITAACAAAGAGPAALHLPRRPPPRGHHARRANTAPVTLAELEEAFIYMRALPERWRGCIPRAAWAAITAWETRRNCLESCPWTQLQIKEVLSCALGFARNSRQFKNRADMHKFMSGLA